MVIDIYHLAFDITNDDFENASSCTLKFDISKRPFFWTLLLVSEGGLNLYFRCSNPENYQIVKFGISLLKIIISN